MCNVHFILTLTPSMTAGQGHQILRFCELFLLTGSSLCSLLRNYSTDFSNDDTNQLREQCRCAACTSFWPWPPPWLQVKVTKYFDFVNYFCWRVVVCVRFSSETTWPISPMMIPINWGNNVDLQHILNFDLHPSMTAGQGPDILWFCEFWCLMGSSLCSLLLRNYSTDFSNADTNLSSEKCRFATYTSSFWPSPLQGHKILQFCEFRLLPWHECWYISGPYKVAGDRLDLVDFPGWIFDTLYPSGQSKL